MLAIAAPTFNQPSETFVRDHVRTLAPGETILLGRAGGGAEAFGCPALEISARHPARRLLGRIAFAMRSLVRSTPLVVRPPRLSDADRKRAAAFLREHRPTALLAEFGPVGVEFAPAAQEAGIPLFVHFHGADASLLLRFPAMVRSYRELFESAAGIMAPSHFLANKLTGIGCPDDILHVSPCGIDPARFRATERRPCHLVAVGRLVEKKAPHLTIEAFARIADRYPMARLDIVGAGPLEGRCLCFVAQHGLTGRVQLHGVRSHDFVTQLMRQASVFVQHSVTAPDGDVEGLGMSILEAMASEVPVVATRHNGIVETVQHGVTGLLVEERDVAGMAAAISELLGNPDRAATMGAAGRARVLEHFTQQRTRDRLRAIMGLPPLSQAVTPATSDCKGDESLANSRMPRRQ